MRFFAAVVVAVVLMLASLLAAETCFLSGEKVDGMNKICFYNCVSGDAAITIKSHQLCPLTLKR